jgi:hypothetical protein
MREFRHSLGSAGNNRVNELVINGYRDHPWSQNKPGFKASKRRWPIAGSPKTGNGRFSVGNPTVSYPVTAASRAVGEPE